MVCSTISKPTINVHTFFYTFNFRHNDRNIHAFKMYFFIVRQIFVEPTIYGDLVVHIIKNGDKS